MVQPKHEITQIAPNTWCVSEFKLVNAFLLVGTEKAALIDAGCGIGDLGAVARSLTEKPLEVLLTHAHPDHTGGLYTLPGCPVYLNEADGPLVQSFPCNNQMRRFFVETRVPVRFPGEGHVEALLGLIPPQEPENQYDWIGVRDGDQLDLGGRVLRAIHTPGHSDGSICYLDAQTRTLFSGDTVNHNIILMRQPGNGTQLIQLYHNSLQKLWECSGEYDQLAIGHDGITVPKQIVHDYLKLTEGLLNGGITGRYEEVGIRKGEVARLGLAELWYQCDQ